MTQSLVLTVAGSVAATLATILLVLRASATSRRHTLALARRWADGNALSAAVWIVPLVAISAFSFANAGATGTTPAPPATTKTESIDWIPSTLATAPSAATAPSVAAPSKSANAIGDTRREDNAAGDALRDGDDASARSARALESLRAYAGRIADKRQALTNMSTADSAPSGQAAANLPDVDTMIARLAARLESEPGDTKSWKMLGWSYLNTGKREEAIKAYETALKHSPDDADLKQALEAAKAQPAAAQNEGPVDGPEESSRSPRRGPSRGPSNRRTSTWSNCRPDQSR